MKKLISIYLGVTSVFGSHSKYIDSLPRSRICGETSSNIQPYGEFTDDLTSMAGDGDACIYRIRNDNHQKIRLTLHELTAHADCTETDHIYVIADNKPYGPFCNPAAKSRHRRNDEIKPTDFIHKTNSVMRNNMDHILPSPSYDRIYQIPDPSADTPADLVHPSDVKLTPPLPSPVSVKRNHQEKSFGPAPSPSYKRKSIINPSASPARNVHAPSKQIGKMIMIGEPEPSPLEKRQQKTLQFRASVDRPDTTQPDVPTQERFALPGYGDFGISDWRDYSEEQIDELPILPEDGENDDLEENDERKHHNFFNVPEPTDHTHKATTTGQTTTTKRPTTTRKTTTTRRTTTKKPRPTSAYTTSPKAYNTNNPYNPNKPNKPYRPLENAYVPQVPTENPYQKPTKNPYADITGKPKPNKKPKPTRNPYKPTKKPNKNSTGYQKPPTQYELPDIYTGSSYKPVKPQGSNNAWSGFNIDDFLNTGYPSVNPFYPTKQPIVASTLPPVTLVPSTLHTGPETTPPANPYLPSVTEKPKPTDIYGPLPDNYPTHYPPQTIAQYEVLSKFSHGTDVEGIFKAEEIDVVYITSPSGYKFRVEFNFEWQMLQTPDDIKNDTMIELFDEFGVPTDEDALCTMKYIYEPGMYVFNRHLESAADPEMAESLYKMIVKSVAQFQMVFHTYEGHCEPLVQKVPCEMMRFTSMATMQEVTGTLKAILERVLSTCEEGFGWQWNEAMAQLEYNVGGVIPDIIIPNVIGTRENYTNIVLIDRIFSTRSFFR